jgi:hypothetical protein
VFYVEVESYTRQKRQHELAKKLKIRRQIRNSLAGKSNGGLHFLSEAGGRLRNLLHILEVDTGAFFGSEKPLDCVVC